MRQSHKGTLSTLLGILLTNLLAWPFLAPAAVSPLPNPSATPKPSPSPTPIQAMAVPLDDGTVVFTGSPPSGNFKTYYVIFNTWSETTASTTTLPRLEERSYSLRAVVGITTSGEARIVAFLSKADLAAAAARAPTPAGGGLMGINPYEFPSEVRPEIDRVNKAQGKITAAVAELVRLGNLLQQMENPWNDNTDIQRIKDNIAAAQVSLFWRIESSLKYKDANNFLANMTLVP